MISPVPPKVVRVLSKIREVGGAPYLVGGAVRDALLHRDAPIKDFDFEVYQLSIDTLIDALSRFGNVETVGRSFGVIKLFMESSLDLDFALPRRESKTGRGHRGFVVSSEPDMPKQEACARRDFTINAMLMDPFSGEIIDFFGGRRDLSEGILRHTSPHFKEDPLRPLRGMQFAARFNMTLHDETAKLCKSLIAEAKTLAHERIFTEWEKWALYGAYPSRGLAALVRMGWDELFGKMAAWGDLDGDTWRRTLGAVDRAARTAVEAALGRGDRLVLMLGALAHTLSSEDARHLLDRIGLPLQYQTRLTALLSHRQRMSRLETVDIPDVLRLSVALKPESIRSLTRLLRNCDPELTIGDRIEDIASAQGVLDGPLLPLVTGRHLIAKGIPPGREMGGLLRTVFDAQLAGTFSDARGADRWLNEFLSSKATNRLTD